MTRDAEGGAVAGRPSPGFALGVAAVAALVVGLSLWLGTHEWFFRDDFVFLARMQDAGSWTWREVFLPLERRLWIFYRPLSMDLFFYWGHRFFGLDAMPYYLFSLGLNFASAPLAYLLARELGLERHAAVAAALLSVSRAPTLTEVFYGSCFMYVAVIFFGLASSVAFLRHLRRGGTGWQLLSCLSLFLAFGCNEVAAALPAVLALAALGAGHASLSVASLARLVWRLAPQALLTAAYLGFRFLLVGPIESDFWNLLVAPTIYAHQLGPHALPNALWLMEEVAGGPVGLAVALGLLAASLVVLARAPAGRDQLGWLGRVAGVCLAWVLLLLPAFALLPQREERWAMMFALPVSLLVGAFVSALFRAYAGRWPARAEAVLVALLFLAVPVPAITARAADPVGGPPLRLAAWVADQDPPLGPDAILVALHGGPDLASGAEAIRLRASTSWGRSLGVVEPGTRRRLRFHDVTQRPARGVSRPDSVYVKLLPGLSFERASPEWLERQLPRRSPDLSGASALR